MPAAPRVFNIPASAPFLPTLIAALLRGELVGGYPPKDDPLALAKATLYLPTRRACQLARAQFLAAMGGDAAVLPRIVPLGHIDEEDIDFVPAGADAVAGALPNSLSPFQRTMALAGLILDWSRKEGMQALGGTPLVASTPAAAFRLANDLGRLMDDMATRQVSWDRLDDLVPTDFDEYWVKTLGFLKIARETWPRYLAEQGLVEPAERQNLLIAAEAERLARSGDPVIAAGSTGSIPATAALLETIAHLPRGAVVLPGLDLLLDDTAWQAIGDADSAPSHPQYAMHGLLRRIGIARAAVKSLGDSQRREVLVSETMRPAALTDVWSAQHHDKVMQAEIAGGMDNIAVIEAANAEEEALAIAISLREAMETPRSSAALVTPDRALARRVKAALARWNIEADDSAADRLADTAAGIFAQLAAEATLGGLQPVPLLALLKHPLCKRDAAALAALERAILRGPRPRAGTAGLARALERFRANRGSLHPSDPRANVTGAELEAAQALARELAASLAPLEAIKPGEQTFAAIARAHRDAVTNLAGELPSLAAVFDDIIENGTLRVTVNDYAELFHAALASTAARTPHSDARVRILGTLESRLQYADRVVLGGLAEGVWPPETGSDAWLSRPMRLELGLDLPERRIGLSAHDFAQALGNPDIVLSAASRVGGAPTVPSRFVQRLAAVAGQERWNKARKSGEKYLTWARALDRPVRSAPIAMPAPKPPAEARPTQISVTDIENWLRDPYTIYAKHILKLFPLEAIDMPPGGRDRGNIIHGAIADFAQSYPAEMPADAISLLQNFGEKRFAGYEDFPEVKAFWWPRFLRVARWLTEEFEARRRPGINTLYTECYGKLPIPLGGSTFTLTGRADRIERLADGSFAILDFKTGAPPTDPQVRTFLSPQLTLEAAMLRNGAFKEIGKGGSVSQLVYVALGGGEPPGKDRIIDLKDSTPDSHADIALTRLAGLVTRFSDPETPYRPLAHPMWKTHYGDYDHLARVKEWSIGSDSENGE